MCPAGFAVLTCSHILGGFPHRLDMGGYSGPIYNVNPWLLCRLAFVTNLYVSEKRGPFIKELPLSNWPVGKPEGHLMTNLGGPSPQWVVLSLGR